MERSWQLAFENGVIRFSVGAHRTTMNDRNEDRRHERGTDGTRHERDGD